MIHDASAHARDVGSGKPSGTGRMSSLISAAFHVPCEVIETHYLMLTLALELWVHTLCSENGWCWTLALKRANLAAANPRHRS